MKKFPVWPSYSSKEIDAVSNVLRSGNVNYWTGHLCSDFESKFAEFSDTDYAISVCNGTVALDIAFHAINLTKGDEVIVTSRTFLASVSSIILSGATPVFCDVSLETQNIHPNFISSLITPKTKAILCVHLAGWPCDMDPILALAREYNLYVIEDCAQAHGALYKGQSVGSLGDIGCWSFCQDKIMTTGGEGGMITTNNKELWEKMWSYKDHGKSYDTVHNKHHPVGFRWLHDSFGSNYRMTEMQAAIGLHQLSLIDKWSFLRNFYQNMIWDACSSIPGIRVPNISCTGCYSQCTCFHAAYKCYVFIRPEQIQHNWSRDKIIHEINSHGVPCFTGSCSEVYLEKAFDFTDFRPEDRLPNAQLLGETSLMFLVHPTLDRACIDYTCEILNYVMTKATTCS